ncbi:MAG: acyl-CoA dehydrogenase family protein [Actinomycetota bacterium]
MAGSPDVSFDLQPVTPAGERFVSLAMKHAEDAARHAAENERTAVPSSIFAEMQASGFMAACLPAEIGGLGVEATTDIAAAFNRLARGDAAVALSSHMHCVTALGFARLWNEARRSGGTLPGWAEDLIVEMVRGEALLCVAGTEPGQTLGWFETTATPKDDGYIVHGRKAFASNSPLATHLYVMLRVPAPNDSWLNAVAVVERDSPGIEIRDDWDPLGMRASASNTIVFDGCLLPRDRIIPVGAPGRLSRYWIRFFVEGTVGLLGAFTGIAESARDLAVQHAQTRRSTVSERPIATRPGVQHQIAEVEVRVACARAGVARIASITDAFYRADAESPLPLAEHHRLMAEYQSTKLVVTRAAIEAVDFALTVSGGAGYLNSHLMSRLYRDVRAGPFMQAYSPNEAYEYIGQVAVGIDPQVTE